MPEIINIHFCPACNSAASGIGFLGSQRLGPDPSSLNCARPRRDDRGWSSRTRRSLFLAVFAAVSRCYFYDLSSERRGFPRHPSILPAVFSWKNSNNSGPRWQMASHPDPLPTSELREFLAISPSPGISWERRGPSIPGPSPGRRVRGGYSLNCAERQRTAAGTPSAATISRNRWPNSVFVA